jgi:selT/selW/selH-like putative selenoprotein
VIADGWAPILTGIELRTGSKGVFKISIDGTLVFDKARAGHFPNAAELTQAARGHLGEKLAWRKTQ